MEQNSTRAETDRRGLFAGEAWFDPIEAGVRDRVRGFIEELLEEELTAFLEDAPGRSFAQLRDDFARVRGALDGLPDFLACLAEVARLPAPLAADVACATSVRETVPVPMKYVKSLAAVTVNEPEPVALARLPDARGDHAEALPAA